MSRCDADSPAARLSRSTLANTWADASPTGVLRAATHSGSQIRRLEAFGLRGVGEQGGHRPVGLDGSAAGLEVAHQPRHGELVGEAEAAGAQQADGQAAGRAAGGAERAGSPGRTQRQPAGFRARWA